MFSDTKFWRLVWKEYRTQRALWLTLLIGTPVLQGALLGLLWLSDDYPKPGRWPDHVLFLFAISYFLSAIYVLGCAATMFSVEHETGTFDFQRVLPANRLRVLCAKIGFGLMSSSALVLLLWGLTMALFGPESQGKASVNWFSGLGLFYLAEAFAWSVVASLLIRHPLWSVILALSAHWIMNYVVLTTLTKTSEIVNFSPFYPTTRMLESRIAVLVMLIVADVVLGYLWFDDRLRLPRWRFRWRRDVSPSYSAKAELPPYVGERQSGWSRMLWLSWRDGRWLIAAFLAWFGNNFYELHHLHNWEMLVPPAYLGSFVFGLLAFAPEQLGGRFRYMAERGCSPRKAWLCRQMICLPPMLLICGGMAWMHSFEPLRDPRFGWNASHRTMMADFAPLLFYSAGQLASMLFRSTVLAIAVGLVLTVFGIFWGNGMSSWLAPLWWSVGSLPVIGLFVTWLKANDWIEERRDRVARWRLVLGLGIPIFLLLATCATYRVVQIPVVQLPADWDRVDDAESKLNPAEKETLQLYRRAFAEQLRARQKLSVDSETRRHELQRAHPEWDNNQRHNADEKVFREQWRSEMAPVIALLAEAHSRPAVALEFLNSESRPAVEVAYLNSEPSRGGGIGGAATTMQPDAWSDFPSIVAQHARHHLSEGNLDEAWQTFEIEWELLRRAQLRVTANSVDPIAPYEEWLREAIVEWGRHPKQSHDRILTAIRRLEAVAQQDVSRHEIHRQLVTTLPLVEDFERWREYVARHFSNRIYLGGATAWWIQWRMQPWERWRFERGLRRQAFFAVSNADGLKRQFESHQPLSLTELNVDLGPYPHEGTLLEDATLPPDMQGGFQFTVFSQFLSRAEAFRATVLRLALYDFHREHGGFPKSLSELVPTYFAEVPRDPSSGGEIVYFPEGVSEDITRFPKQHGAVPIDLPKGIPFLLTTDGTGSPLSRQGRDGNWEFTDLSGKELTIETALKNARFWVLEPSQPSSE